MKSHRRKWEIALCTLAAATLLAAAMDVSEWRVRSAFRDAFAISSLLVVVLGVAQVRTGRSMRRLRRDLDALRRRVEVEERCRGALERLDVGTFVVKEGRFIEVNSAMERLAGCSRHELLGMNATELCESPEDLRLLMRCGDSRNDDVFDCRIRVRRADGRAVDSVVAATMLLDDAQESPSLLGVIRDAGDERRIEEALRVSEAEYRALFDHAHDAIIILDPVNEVVLDANPSACRLYGFSYEEFVGKSMIDLSVDAAGRLHDLKRTMEQNGRYLPLVSQQFRSDGSVVDVEINAARVMYKGREVILSINRDVTARRREDLRVRESEERFRLLLESVVDYAIYMLDPEGRVVSWNEGAERTCGFSASDVLGQSFSMFYTPAQRVSRLPENDLAAAAESGRIAREEVHLRKDGSSFIASVVLTRIVDEAGALRGFARVTRDVTEKKNFQETQKQILTAIQNVAREWTRTFDAVPLPIVLLDDRRRIRRLNQAAARLAGKPLKSLLERDVCELEGEPWQTIGSVADFFVAHGVIPDARAEDEKSARVWQVSSTPVELNGERRLIVIAHDLTLITRLEESLRRTELTAALGALVAGVAHEVRNPLFTISATLDTCEARLGSVPGLQDYLSPLRAEITRLNELMNDLLDYAKPHPLDLEEISFLDVAREAITQSCAGKWSAEKVILDCGESLPALCGDQRRLQQVLRNVIENALQHSPADSPIVVRLRNDGLAVLCEVLDSGRGLSKEDLARAFVPFYTRRKGGTGLGLSIAQKIVAAHGGEIALRNREAGGAVVTIGLPLPSSASSAGAQ